MSDTRLSRMMHVLVHMQLLGGSETSEVISRMLNTHPVVVRRTMALLRDAGIVTSVGGRSGGWTLARPAEAISMLDVFSALDGQTFAIGLSDDHRQCPVEQQVNHLIGHALDKAGTVLRQELGRVTVAALAAQHQGTATV